MTGWRFEPKTAGGIVREMGYVDASGAAGPPFRWNEGRRLRLRAKFETVFFHLYGIAGRGDARYVFSTFLIVERREVQAYRRYRSRDFCLAWMNAPAAIAAYDSPLPSALALETAAMRRKPVSQGEFVKTW